MTQPTVIEPEKGYLVPNIDLTPLCTPKFRPGMTNDEAQVFSAIVDDLIKNSNWIDPKQLCISKEKLVWILYCDVSCIDFDGGILDASVVAICAALRCCEYAALQLRAFLEIDKCGLRSSITIFQYDCQK